MIIKKYREKIDVFHDNGYKIGTFGYSEVWDEWILRTELVGLNEKDLLKLYKIMRRLK